MAGAAASEGILFIGAVIAASVLVTALLGVGQHLSTGLTQRADALEEQLAGRIVIVNDPLHMTTSPLTLYVKNTGSNELYLGSFIVMLDGVPSENWSVTVGGAAADTIKPSELATITINDLTVAAGDHSVKVISSSNHVATLEFNA